MSEQFPRNKVLRLEEAVEYAAQSIVSKQVIKQPAGNLTLFAFDGQQELSEHTAPFDALVQVLDGSVQVRIGGKDYRLERGESIIMPAGIPHALKAVTRFKMLLSMIRS